MKNPARFLYLCLCSQPSGSHNGKKRVSKEICVKKIAKNLTQIVLCISKYTQKILCKENQEKRYTNFSLNKKDAIPL